MVTLKRMRSIAFGVGCGGGGAQAPTEGRYPRNGIGYGAAAAGQRERKRSGRDLWQVCVPPNLQSVSVQIQAAAMVTVWSRLRRKSQRLQSGGFKLPEPLKCRLPPQWKLYCPQPSAFERVYFSLRQATSGKKEKAPGCSFPLSLLSFSPPNSPQIRLKSSSNFQNKRQTGQIWSCTAKFLVFSFSEVGEEKKADSASEAWFW